MLTKNRKTGYTYCVVLVIVLALPTTAIAQDTQSLLDERNGVNIAIIKLGAMIELNNLRILDFNRAAAKFDDEMKRLRAQAEKLKQKITAMERSAVKPAGKDDEQDK